ncbi:retrovirus-related pol polyprotein from transposon TNT 1-94 [Tanacetum coccineum]
MTILAEFMIVVGGENRPPMLDKTMYDSWESRMELYIEAKENDKMMLNSVKNGPLIWPTVDEDGVTRVKRYEELSVTEKQQADCDLRAANIVLQELPPDVYSLVNHHRVAKDIWDRVKLLMQGTSLSKQEREFNQLPPPNSPQLYLPPSVAQQPHAEFYQSESNLVTPSFQQGEDPIDCINKAMVFLSDVPSRFPSTNNQLRTSSNPKNQANIQDGRFMIQQVQGRQVQSYVGTGTQGNATGSGRNNAAGQGKVVKCYNCQGEGHMTRQFTKPKRRMDATWFKEKVLLVQTQAEGKELDEEQLAFLADPRLPNGQAAQTTIPQNAAFQTEDLDA